MKILILFVVLTEQLFAMAPDAGSAADKRAKILAAAQARAGALNRLDPVEPSCGSAAAVFAESLAPRILTPEDIKLESFIMLALPQGFTVHGDSNIGSLLRDVESELTKFLLTLKPWMPRSHPVLLTESNRGIFQYLDHDLHDSKTVMQMGVFFSEYFGKHTDPVMVYFTRPYIDGEALSSDEIFKKPSSGKCLFDLAIKGSKSEIIDVIGRNPLNYIPLNTTTPLHITKFWVDLGIASAQNNLGYMYHHGVGVVQDYAETLRYYRLSADQGNASAQNNLGYMYENGLGVAQDYAETLRYYRLSADQGNASAQNNLGYMYHHGVGVAQDYAEALRLFRLSADQGCADAQNSLGYMYQHGIGVAQNYTEALRLFRLSADQGNATAQNYLGLLKVAGLGCEQNLPEAFSLYRQLALKPDAEPLDKFNYGVFVYFGICTERNTVRGIELMTAALGLNHPRVSYMFHKLHHNSLIEGAAMNEAARYLSLAHDHNVNDAQKLWVETLLDKGQEIAMAEAVRISAESARAVEVAPKQRWWCC